MSDPGVSDSGGTNVGLLAEELAKNVLQAKKSFVNH
jgi:hypothetical protein